MNLVDGVLVPGSSDPCDSWITYHKTLENKFGGDAKSIFVMSWGHAGSSSCSLDRTFSHYFEKQGIDTGNFLTDVAGGAIELGSDIFGIFGGAAKALRIVVPIAIVGVTAMFLYMMYRNAKTWNSTQAVGAVAGAVAK